MAESITVETFEETRQNLLDKYSGVSDRIEKANNRIEVASELDEFFKNSDFEKEISNIDVVAFVGISVMDKGVENNLFGEVSSIIENAISSELDEVMEPSTDTSYRKQMTPVRLVECSSEEKRQILSSDILDDLDEVSVMTIRCMEMYNDICQDSKSVSERSRKKMQENQNLLYIITSKIRFNDAYAESHMKDSSLYTVALVSNIKDGTRPDIAKYKSKILSSINTGISKLTGEKNIKNAIKIFDASNTSLGKSGKYLETINSPSAETAKDTINALQEIYKEKLREIKNLYEKELNSPETEM